MNKFKVGGRCGGDSSSGASAKGDTQGVASSFSALMAARDAQDRALTAPAIQTTPNQQAIVIAKKPIADKQKIMDFILQGDMNDD